MSGVLGVPVPDQQARADESHKQRMNACKMPDRGTARSVANGEELLYGETFAANFHKGLPHTNRGFVEPAAYREYVDALLNQDHARFEAIAAGENFSETTHPRHTMGGPAAGKKHRKLTSPFAGHVYDLEGADAGALAVAPAPVLASDELAAEMAELYVMALLRDESFSDITAGTGDKADLIGTLTDALQGMAWFKPDNAFRAVGDRRRPLTGPEGLFRGSTPGSHKGPWLSQFLLVGNQGPPPLVRNQRPPDPDAPPLPHLLALPEVKQGLVYYGAQVVDQRTVTAEPKNDWMQTWAAWLDAQNGVDFNNLDLICPERQFITTPRDIVTYVHFDALYQAYQVACLLMLAGGSPFKFDRGLPESHSRTRNAFVTFGGPHVLTLVAEVATRALKAVWRQKWMHHRRLRPEVVAAYLTLWTHKPNDIPDPALRDALATLYSKMPADILEAIATMNTANTKTSPTLSARAVKPNRPAVGLPKIKDEENYLLPMAFPEGSPTHPAYGAGHATVAGACVTALKAFFEMYEPDGETPLEWPLTSPNPMNPDMYGFGEVYVGGGPDLKVAPDWPKLTPQGEPDKLTIQGELDKLAGNIAIARNMAGVHYYTDYFASLRMGERVTVSVLQDQAAQYGERMSMSFTSFDGDRIRVSGQNGRGEVSIIDRDGHAVSPPDWFQRYS
ncbi:hypothetical protein [Deinococcus sp. AJ005]|uniref:hypothetical protein n=1 Tax=Deinococcus sp. AJ005 TaxID=2652443 RepID=UPI00125CC88C|nr:hypothetical protein [Deinococcus sp. AJ005]QFP77893.1 hypothetical protein DAAJ005_16645 [Deinococcus sp. AJ005]